MESAKLRRCDTLARTVDYDIYNNYLKFLERDTDALHCTTSTTSSWIDASQTASTTTYTTTLTADDIRTMGRTASVKPWRETTFVPYATYAPIFSDSETIGVRRVCSRIDCEHHACGTVGGRMTPCVNCRRNPESETSMLDNYSFNHEEPSVYTEWRCRD